MLVLLDTIFLDHKPHMGLFSESKEIPIQLPQGSYMTATLDFPRSRALLGHSCGGQEWTLPWKKLNMFTMSK